MYYMNHEAVDYFSAASTPKDSIVGGVYHPLGFYAAAAFPGAAVTAAGGSWPSAPTTPCTATARSPVWTARPAGTWAPMRRRNWKTKRPPGGSTAASITA